ncbi:hypothetical protein RKD28_007141 [Streptomyces sp. SAI-229]
MSRRTAEPVELAALRGWLRAAKGQRTFAALARRADAGKLPVSVCTLRRALDGRLPTLRTVQAFVRGAEADEAEGARVWAAAASAVRPEPVRKPAAYVPGRGITTLAGLAVAMEKVRAAAGGPSLRRLADSPEAAGRLSRSALHNALTGRRLPSEELLAGFASGFNRSLQHLVLGGVDGQASRVDGVVDRTVTDEVPGCAGASAGSGTSVLAGDREGGARRGGGSCGWSIPGGGLQVVPSRWRHATNGSCSAVRPVPVLSRA